jgi:hypothetical protein
MIWKLEKSYLHVGEIDYWQTPHRFGKWHKFGKLHAKNDVFNVAQFLVKLAKRWIKSNARTSTSN